MKLDDSNLTFRYAFVAAKGVTRESTLKERMDVHEMQGRRSRDGDVRVRVNWQCRGRISPYGKSITIIDLHDEACRQQLQLI